MRHDFRVCDGELVAGRDVSEFAYDCSEIRTQVKHGRAAISSSFPIARPRNPCDGHRYVSVVALEHATDVRSVKVRWVAGQGVFALRYLTLIDGARKCVVPPSRRPRPRAGIAGAMSAIIKESASTRMPGRGRAPG